MRLKPAPAQSPNHDLQRPDLEELRRYIGEREHAASAENPAVSRGIVSQTVSLGADELDAMLPAGGLAAGALHECVPAGHGDFAAGLGFTFALAARMIRDRPGFVLWVSTIHGGREQGMIHAPGLAAFGLDPGRFIQVGVDKAQSMLWVMEEGLGADGAGNGGPDNGGLAAVIGVLGHAVPGKGERAYDFTASRRLAMRAQKSGIPALLVREQGGQGGEMQGVAASAAATRWRIAAAPFPPGQRMARNGGVLDEGALIVSTPRWAVELVKSKGGTAGRRRIVEWNHETLSFRLAAALADRAPPASDVEQAGDRAGGRKWAAAS